MSVELAKKAPAKPAFRKMNEHLVCSLCKGYLVDATTIVECLHSFCRSCIVQYLQASSFCPTCEVQLHKGSPLRSLKPDKTLQDIVYKLVPNLFHNEMRRRRVYYDTHPQYADQTTPEQRGDCLERFYSPDDSVSLSLEYHDRRKSSAAPAPSSPPADEPKSSSPPSSTSSSSPPADGQKSLPPKRYLKCPALFTIGLLKKFIRLKFDLPQELVIDIFQRRESLADEYTLLDIAYIYPWKTSEPMKFFYRVRDPRVPESDEEVEREMPSLSAAVGGRATRASRRASSASSLASPLGSPRGSPVPSGKRSRPDMEEKECDKQDPTPPPARLTAQPPTGAAVHPKPVAVKPVPSPTSPGPTGPKITLTISPSRGTVTSTTTEPATPKSPPPAAPTLKPATAAPTPTPTPAPAPVKKNGAATPAAVKNGPATPKTPSFAATVTTKTANGGFVTVKNPIARPLNGVTVGSKTPASPQHVPASPKMTPILPKPAQGVPKAKRLTNGLPLLAPKGDVRAYSQSPQASAKPPTPTAPAPPSNMALPAAEAASRRTTTPVTASNARPSAPSAPAPKPAASPAPAPSQATEAPSAAQKQEEEKKTMETAKAILQLSMGFKQSRSDTPTDSTLHNHIDKIVKDLDDDESNDGTLVIKSEPSSPASSGARSPVPSPNPQPPTATPAALPPSLPKVNGLTITPIEPSKRKATSSPALEEKRPRMEQATAGKRPAEGPPPSPAAPKQAKVDKIADLIKRKQEQERLHSQQERDKKAATQQPQSGGQPNALRPVGNPSQAAKPALNSTKPSSPLTKQPLSSPTTLKSFPPAQMKPIAPKPPGIPANAQGKPVSQAAAAMPGQPSASMAAKAAPAAPPSTQHQTKPAAAGAAARPTSAPQSHQDKLSQQTAGKPTSAPKPSSAPQAQGQQQQQAKSTAAPPARSPSGAQGLQQLQQTQQAKTAASQHGAARQVQQSKPAPAQPGPQAKAAAAPQQGQPSKPAPAQPAKQVSFGAAREQDNGAKMAMEARKRATPSPQQSPQQSAVKSPESKSKKPIPDLQRLQRPPPSLTGTTVNGCVSLAEVKEQLAKKGQYSPPPGQQPPNKTPPRLLEMSQRRSAPPAPSGASGTPGAPGGFGALDLSSASPRASDHGGSWTPPPSLGLAQALAKRQQLMMAPQGLPLRPPPSSLSSLSSSSPSPPADSPGSVSLSPDLFLDPAVLAQHQAALLHQLQLQSLFQTQAAGLSAGLSAGLKKTMEEWDRSRGGVRATAKRK